MEENPQVVKVDKEFISSRIRQNDFKKEVETVISDPSKSSIESPETRIVRPETRIESSETRIEKAETSYGRRDILDASDTRAEPSFMRKIQPLPGEVFVKAEVSNQVNQNSYTKENNRNLNQIALKNLPLGSQERTQVVKVDKEKDPYFQVVKVDKELALENFPVSEMIAFKGGPSEETLSLIRNRMKRRYESSVIERGLNPGVGSQPGRIEGTLVSRATLDQYLRRGTMLFDRWKLVTGQIFENDEDADPVMWINWLLSLKPSLESSTWRMYRQSALNWLDGFPGGNSVEAMRLIETDTIEGSHSKEINRRRKGRGITGITSINGESDEEIEDRTSALKEKKLPEDALDRIKLRLRMASRSKLSETLIDWLDAALLTGLRPIEWSAVDLVVRELPSTDKYPHARMVLLYVINAKATNGRGTGVARTLDLSLFSEREFSIIRRHVNRSRIWLKDDKFNEVKGQCSTLLRKTVSSIWPKGENGGIADGKHYAMYSCRHQAIANWKSMDIPLEEIAAIVGHNVTSTTTERYGKRRSGWKIEKIPAPPRGLPEEIMMVRNRIDMFNDRIKMEKDLGIVSKGPTDFTI